MVPKPSGGTLFVIDYRSLNKALKIPQMPMPRIDETLDKFGKSAYWSKIDLRSGYWQVGLNPAHKERSAFVTPQGQWQWTRMPMGLAVSPAVFQSLMNDILEPHNNAMVYQDDCICYSNSFTDHLEHLGQMLALIREAGLKISPEKSEFGSQSINYLGFKVSAAGHGPDPEKVKCIVQCPPPRTLRELRAFLGVASYYRRWIRAFAQKARPLTDLLKADVPFEWGPKQEEAFQQLKDALTSEPILRRPDYSRPFLLYTDWAPGAVAAILAQKDEEDREYVVAYASRVLRGAELNYEPVHGELLALVWAVQYFRHYLYGHPFEIYTDHSCLRYLMGTKNLTGKLARWAMLLVLDSRHQV